MIVISTIPFAIGERGCGVIDKDRVDHHDAPFQVLRVATAQEYLAELRADGVAMTKRLLRWAAEPGQYFYEISTD